MGKVVFSKSLAQGAIAKAADVTTMLDELKDGANAIEDANIGPEGISESNITFNTSTGHDHDGDDGGQLLALAVEGGNQGALKVRKEEVATNLVDGTWSGNLNATGDDQIDTVLAVTAMWRSGTHGAGEACHTNKAGGLPTTGDYDAVWSTRYHGADDESGSYSSWYIVVDDTQTPNEVYLYNDTGRDMVDYVVMMLGI